MTDKQNSNRDLVKRLLEKNLPDASDYLLAFKKILRDSKLYSKVFLYILDKHLDESKDVKWVSADEIGRAFAIPYIRAYQVLERFDEYVVRKSDNRIQGRKRYFILENINDPMYLDQVKESLARKEKE